MLKKFKKGFQFEINTIALSLCVHVCACARTRKRVGESRINGLVAMATVGNVVIYVYTHTHTYTYTQIHIQTCKYGLTRGRDNLPLLQIMTSLGGNFGTKSTLMQN